MGPAAEVAARDAASGQRNNETALARLRPGKDKLGRAVELFGPHYRRVVPGSDDVLAWVDRESRAVVRLELASAGTIESVTLSANDPLLEEADGPAARLPAAMLRTGRGLRLGDSRSRALRLYGTPATSGPSTQKGQELELLFYAFDWAGSDVPQVMEVSCERQAGRVVQITLAFPSL